MPSQEEPGGEWPFIVDVGESEDCSSPMTRLLFHRQGLVPDGLLLMTLRVPRLRLPVGQDFDTKTRMHFRAWCSRFKTPSHRGDSKMQHNALPLALLLLRKVPPRGLEDRQATETKVKRLLRA